MEQPENPVTTIDEYIAACPNDVQERLQAMRAIIKVAAPDAKEIISYAMPAFALHGNLVYFAATKDHTSFYPTSSGIAAFQDELSAYKSTKGAVRFPNNQPLPTELITKIVQFRVAEDRAKVEAKARKKKGRAVARK